MSEAKDDVRDNGDPPFYWSAEDRFLAAVYRGYLTASPVLDSFSNWTMAVAGVAVAGLLSGLGELPTDIQEASAAVVAYLVLAGLFTLFNKVGRLSLLAAVNSADRVAEEVNHLGQRGLVTLDWEAVEAGIARPLLWPLRWPWTP